MHAFKQLGEIGARWHKK